MDKTWICSWGEGEGLEVGQKLRGQDAQVLTISRRLDSPLGVTSYLSVVRGLQLLPWKACICRMVKSFFLGGASEGLLRPEDPEAPSPTRMPKPWLRSGISCFRVSQHSSM